MLSDEQFKTGVENCDGEVRPWNQDRLVDKRAYMDKGACAQLAAVWLRNQKFKALGHNVPDKQACLEEVSWMCEQKHKGRANAAFEEFLSGNGLKRDSGRIIFGRNFNLENASFFVSAQKAYYLVGAIGDDDGHGIAFDTKSQYLGLFDPNYGEARFRNLAGLGRFFKAYWGRAYPDLHGQGFVERYF